MCLERFFAPLGSSKSLIALEVCRQSAIALYREKSTKRIDCLYVLYRNRRSTRERVSWTRSFFRSSRSSRLEESERHERRGVRQSYEFLRQTRSLIFCLPGRSERTPSRASCSKPHAGAEPLTKQVKRKHQIQTATAAVHPTPIQPPSCFSA